MSAQCVDDAVQRRGRAHDGLDQCVVGAVVAADLDGLALHGVELGDDLLLVLRERGGDRRERRRELGVLRLRRELLRPVEPQVEVASAVVDRAESATRRAVLFEEGSRRSVQRLREDAGLLVARAVCEVLERSGQREELAQGIPCLLYTSPSPRDS